MGSNTYLTNNDSADKVVMLKFGQGRDSLSPLLLLMIIISNG